MSWVFLLFIISSVTGQCSVEFKDNLDLFSYSTLTHFMTPQLSSSMNVLVYAVRQKDQSFVLKCISMVDMSLIWTIQTNFSFLYVAPSIAPPYPMALDPLGKSLYFVGPNALYVCHDLRSGSFSRVASLDESTWVNTGLAVDSRGSIFFGMRSPDLSYAYLVRVVVSGGGGVSYFSVAHVPSQQVAAIDPLNGSFVLFAASLISSPHVVSIVSLSLDDHFSLTMSCPCMDPSNTSQPCQFTDLSSSSPVIHPLSHHIYMGCLTPSRPSGWLLHFSSSMTPLPPGPQGWDITPSFMLPGPGIILKHNQYSHQQHQQQQQHALVVLDPSSHSVMDPFGSHVMVMSSVASALSPNQQEWCVNRVAWDASSNTAVASCEDSVLYKWNVATGSNKVEKIVELASAPLAQSYTPVVVQDKTIVAINMGMLNVVRCHANIPWFNKLLLATLLMLLSSL